MKSRFSDIELDLLDLMYPVPNHPDEQRELWRKIRGYSTAPQEVLDKIETMLPSGEFYDQSGGLYACDGAALFAIVPDQTSPIGIERTDHSRLLDSLTKIDKPKEGDLVLMCFYETRQTSEPEFHFAIDLGLKGREKVSFHKPGGINPAWLTFTTNITEQYSDYRAEYFSLPKVSR